ncbi:MAG: hypothetical protein IIW91_10280 [Alistipes sp.]|nr:hypothetical protein [Alistipes sp.]MBQ5923704.1 hypothetical protein [Alistipes sp.]
MKEDEKYWPTVIILEGEPFVLKYLNREGVNDPCSMCDLRDKCMTDEEERKFLAFCKSDGRSDDWYFEVDWDIYPKQVGDLLNVVIDDQDLPEAHTANSDHHTTLEEWIGGRTAVTTVLIKHKGNRITMINHRGDKWNVNGIDDDSALAALLFFTVKHRYEDMRMLSDNFAIRISMEAVFNK